MENDVILNFGLCACLPKCFFPKIKGKTMALLVYTGTKYNYNFDLASWVTEREGEGGEQLG